MGCWTEYIWQINPSSLCSDPAEWQWCSYWREKDDPNKKSKKIMNPETTVGGWLADSILKPGINSHRQRPWARTLSDDIWNRRWASISPVLPPFHYYKWMFLLKRWKPIISNYFSSQISIWIRIHGLPLHYWTLNTIHTIRR